MNLPSAKIMTDEAFLGVESSITGKLWTLRKSDDRLVLAITQRFGLAELVARTIASRGHQLEGISAFLEPRLRDVLPDPNCLKDMSIAAHRIVKAIKSGENIAILGDYDVDGATSSALLCRFISQVAASPYIYIPNRLTEGYGPNISAFDTIKASGARVVITVDCGATAYEPLEYAAKLGLDVIIADHHSGEARSPSSFAFVNPNRFDEDGVYGELAAVGVAFLLAIAVNRELRAIGWYSSMRPEPNIFELLDLVALGTVCDVVPLRGVNRALVAQGLKVMGQRKNVGITALSDLAGVDTAPSAYHAGFVLGPRVNAGGRIGECGLGSQLLSTNNKNEAWAIAEKLNQLNKQRQEIEKSVLNASIEVIKLENKFSKLIIVASGEDWHPGVIGIVASRVTEQYYRPSCIISRNLETGVGVGSARSVTGVNIGAAILSACQKKILINGGGHAMAAGFRVSNERIDEFEEYLCDYVKYHTPNHQMFAKITLDGAIQSAGMTLSLIQNLECLAPFGCGNPEPRLAISSARLLYADRVGENHVRCKIVSGRGKGVNAIAFKSLDNSLGKALLSHDGMPFHLAGKLRKNNWNGTSAPQFIIEDAAEVWEGKNG